jgi:hypoxanthine phosphoribosyltransferase
MMTIDKDKLEMIRETADCLCSESDINAALDKMAEEITRKLKDTHPVILAVMTGALIPMGHLLTRLRFPLETDYLHATRYRGAMRGGDLHWLVEPKTPLAGRTVLIMDDVMDGGLTLAAIIDYCKQAGAEAVYTAVMVDKVRQREPGVNFEPDFVGLKVEDRFLFGFGLDYHGYWRNLHGIYAVKD